MQFPQWVRLRRCILSILIIFVGSLGARAGEDPVGQWRTIDDRTGETKSIVEIYRAEDGTLEGRVLQVLKSDQGPHPICKECPGERKDQPIEGMVILWHMTPEANRWTGGRILDPKNGKIYRCRLEVMADGSLEVRGFIGVSLIGRTQRWLRVEPEG